MSVSVPKVINKNSHGILHYNFQSISLIIVLQFSDLKNIKLLGKVVGTLVNDVIYQFKNKAVATMGVNKVASAIKIQ